MVILSATSQSRLNRYLQCPLSYKLYYIDHRPESVGIAAVEGSEDHSVLAGYAKHCIDEGVMTDLDWIRSYPASPGAREVLDVCADTLMFEKGIYWIEERVELDIAEGYPFVAIMDLVKDEPERLIITDYKSDRKIRSQSDVDDDIQGKVYAVVASIHWPGKDEYVFEMNFIRHGVTRQVVYKAEDIPKLREELIALTDRMLAEQEYEARPGPRCSSFNCAFTADCPKADPLAVSSDEDIETQVERFIALQAALKSCKDYLAPAISKEGAIEVNGLALDYWPVDSRKYTDKAKLKATLTTLGEKPDDYFSPDTTKLKKLAKKNAETEEALLSISIDNSSTRFETRKVKK